tara:strand:- start:241 stop:462 length:222 start_codon:yes stop_codon:yes gene_type:complete
MDISKFPKFLRDRIKNKGLGDVVKESIETLTYGKVSPCAGCKHRQEILNALLRFKELNDAEAKLEEKDDSSGD